MIKYLDTQVTLREVPDEISLCINLTNCPFKCEGCHSPELREDIGEELTKDVLSDLITKNEGITCVCFMGGDSNHIELFYLLEYVKKNFPFLKTAIYSGYIIADAFLLTSGYIDYYKYGPYIKELGGLDNPKTNQVMLQLNKNSETKIINNKFIKK